MAKEFLDKVVAYAPWVPVYDVRKDRDAVEFKLKVANGNHSKFIGTSPSTENHNFKVREGQDIAAFYKKKSPETTYKQIKALAKAAGGYRKLEL